MVVEEGVEQVQRRQRLALRHHVARALDSGEAEARTRREVSCEARDLLDWGRGQLGGPELNGHEGGFLRTAGEEKEYRI